jgi:branched-subunit amino acid transport protein
MSGAFVWSLIVAMAVVTFALRVTFLLLHERISFPPLVRRALRYVPYAVLAALVVPAVLNPGGAEQAPGVDRILAGLVGAVVAWRTGSVLLTLLVGMAALWLGQLWLGNLAVG